ncbi:TPD1 protein-like [Heracleum sosnowskyi]|uniref:TPD1 protein-like n=1 Tax=Heracleum sosnowskyi TaxID=360622 RepID=A0AAD8MPC5_9APIA|nr:TPD1 protein-like [Heracleum sosnowskyi]
MGLRWKLYQSGSDGSDGPGGSDGSSGSVKRIGLGCSKSSINVFQGQTAPLPSGIPTYTATVENICVTGCTISNIHLSCGWFSSARSINPRVFRRLSYNDCLVNDGQPLGPGQTITFQYANTFSYPLAVSSITCI